MTPRLEAQVIAATWAWALERPTTKSANVWFGSIFLERKSLLKLFFGTDDFFSKSSC